MLPSALSLHLFYYTSDCCACGLLTAHIFHLPRTQLCCCSEDLFLFQSYWSSDILHKHFGLLLGNSMVVLQILFTNLTFLTYDWFPVIIISESWRVPHVGQEMLIFLEHLILLPLGSSWFHPFIIYTLQNLSVLRLYGFDFSSYHNVVSDIWLLRICKILLLFNDDLAFCNYS